MAKLEVSSSRPRLRWYYWPDSRPRYVIAGTDYEGSWQRHSSVTIEVPPGRVQVSAWYLPWHPIARRHKPSLRRAKIDLEVPAGDATIVLEFRPSRLWSQPGKLRRKDTAG